MVAGICRNGVDHFRVSALSVDGVKHLMDHNLGQFQRPNSERLEMGVQPTGQFAPMVGANHRIKVMLEVISVVQQQGWNPTSANSHRLLDCRRSAETPPRCPETTA